MKEPDWWKLKDALACEMEIRAGDLAFEDEADAVFAAARWTLEAHKRGEKGTIAKSEWTGVRRWTLHMDGDVDGKAHGRYLLIPLDSAVPAERGEQP